VTDVLSLLSRLIERGETFMLMTVVAKLGSGPAQIGSKMLIQAGGGTTGTIGGGALELMAIEHGRELLRQGRSELKAYRLSEDEAAEDQDEVDTGMPCGGRITVFYEYYGPRDNVYIFGAGHIGQAVARALEPLPYRVAVIDGKPGAAVKYDDVLAGRAFPEGAFFIVATYSHDTDYEVLKHILRSDLKPRYIGVVASKRKIAGMLKKLRSELRQVPDLGMLYSPAGLDLGGSTPGEIAVSIVSEIIAVTNCRQGHRHMRAT
jgi:xanthine dehydrogenase accessory factor